MHISTTFRHIMGATNVQDGSFNTAKEKVRAELNTLQQEFLSLTEGVLEQRYHVLNTAEQNLLHSHLEQLRNMGLISGVVAPFSLTLLQLDSVEVNAPLLLLGFVLIIANIALSLFLLHKELERKNKLVTDASVKLNFASSVRNNLAGGEDMAQKIGIEPMSFFMNNIRETDKALGISTHNTESLMTKVRLRKYDKLLIYLFSLGCVFIISAVIFAPITQFLATIFTRLV